MDYKVNHVSDNDGTRNKNDTTNRREGGEFSTLITNWSQMIMLGRTE